MRIEAAEAEDGAENENRGRPQPAPDQDDADRAADRRPGLAEPLVDRAIGRGRIADDGSEAEARADIADQAGTDDDRRERNVQREDRHEGDGGDRDGGGRPQRPPADADDRVDDDGEYRRLEAEEEAFEPCRLAEGGVDGGEGENDDEAGKDEQPAGGDAAAGAVQEPADIGRELLRLRSRQEHAEVEGVQEAALRDPLPLVDEDAVHQRDLPGRPAEADEPDRCPHLQRFAKGRTDTRRRPKRRGFAHAGFPVADGQLCFSSVASRHQR